MLWSSHQFKYILEHFNHQEMVLLRERADLRLQIAKRDDGIEYYRRKVTVFRVLQLMSMFVKVRHKTDSEINAFIEKATKCLKTRQNT